MMDSVLQHVATNLGQVANILVVLACAVLFMRRRSSWILIALIGELAALACHMLVVLSPQTYTQYAFLRLLWPLNSCIFAIGLLGYAWFETAPRADSATPANPGAQP